MKSRQGTGTPRGRGGCRRECEALALRLQLRTRPLSHNIEIGKCGNANIALIRLAFGGRAGLLEIMAGELVNI